MLSKTSGHGLSDDDRRRLTVVFIQESTDVISDWVAFKMLNEEFFRAASKVGCPWNFYPVFVVEALLACSLSNPIRVVCSLIKPLMIGVHLALKTFQIKTKKRVAFAHSCSLLRFGHVHSPCLYDDPLSSTRWASLEACFGLVGKESSCHDGQKGVHGRSRRCSQPP